MGIACSWSRCIDGFPRSSRPSRSSVPRLSYVGIEPASVGTGGGNPALLEADRRLLPVSVVGCYFWVDRPLALFAHDQTKQFDIFVTLTYSRGVDGACARRVRGTRTARIEQSTPVKTPNDSGIGCGKPGDRRTAQGPAQIHFRAYVARDLGSQQSLFHSRRGLWVQSVSWGPGVCIVSLRSHHGHLRGDVGFVDVLSPLSTPLRHVRRGRRNWSHRRRLSFSQRLHRRSVPRRVDRVVHRRRMGMRQAAHTGASHREGPARKDFRTLALEALRTTWPCK